MQSRSADVWCVRDGTLQLSCIAAGLVVQVVPFAIFTAVRDCDVCVLWKRSCSRLGSCCCGWRCCLGCHAAGNHASQRNSSRRCSRVQQLFQRYKCRAHTVASGSRPPCRAMELDLQQGIIIHVKVLNWDTDRRPGWHARAVIYGDTNLPTSPRYPKGQVAARGRLGVSACH